MSAGAVTVLLGVFLASPVLNAADRDTAYSYRREVNNLLARVEVREAESPLLREMPKPLEPKEPELIKLPKIKLPPEPKRPTEPKKPLDPVEPREIKPQKPKLKPKPKKGIMKDFGRLDIPASYTFSG